jgi:hypothetical protein
MEKTLEEKMPAYKEIQLGSLIANLLLSTLMIISGIGLLQMRAWGRTLSIVYALLSILNHIFTIVYGLAFSVPAMRAVFQDLAAQDPNAQPFLSVMETAVTASAIIPALYAIYPIVVLVIMFRPTVVQAFRKGQDEISLPEEESAEGDLPWGRRPTRSPGDDHFRAEDL